MATNTKLIAAIPAAAALGAAGEYFADPVDGKRRRHVARDKIAASFRRPARKAVAETERTARYAEGVAHGIQHRVGIDRAGSHDPSLLNDPGLEAKVESEIFRSPDAPKGAVSINVENRVVYLRGEVASQAEIERLVNSVKAVDGVGEVRSLLHVPGEPAPMKA